jgi:hypothetical protein
MKQPIKINVLDFLIISATLVIGFIIVKKLLNSPQKTLKKEAEKDLEYWKARTETDPLVSKQIVSYWKSAGRSYTDKQMQSRTFQESMPWSSAYISDLVLRSGFKNFKGHISHAGYTIDAKNNRKTNKKDSFKAYKPNEQKEVEVGNILVASRTGATVNLDTLTIGVKTHGDIVIEVYKKNNNNYAKVIGGNVSNKISTNEIELTSSKTLPSTDKHFAHLKYN